tara:strand:- start:383 stop:601 length:219 start_codon:yes stop_codon:yes gene_type:complete
MAKQLDKDMLRMMTITERFNYIAAKKQMQMIINKDPNDKDDWVDRDDDSGYDSSSDGKKNGGDESYDDSNEY